MSKEQAVVPQAKPVRIACPSSDKNKEALCQEVVRFAEGGQLMRVNKMVCPPGSPSWKLSGQLNGETIDALLACNSNSRQGDLKTKVIAAIN